MIIALLLTTERIVEVLYSEQLASVLQNVLLHLRQEGVRVLLEGSVVIASSAVARIFPRSSFSGASIS